MGFIPSSDRYLPQTINTGLIVVSGMIRAIAVETVEIVPS